MSDKTPTQRVVVANAYECAGEANGGAVRAVLLAIILATSSCGFDLVIDELRVQNEILGTAHNIDVQEIRTRIEKE